MADVASMRRWWSGCSGTAGRPTGSWPPRSASLHAAAIELAGRSETAALAEVDWIGATVTEVLSSAAFAGIPPHRAARRIAEARLVAAAV
jgi:hypothetical protein